MRSYAQINIVNPPPQNGAVLIPMSFDERRKIQVGEDGLMKTDPSLLIPNITFQGEA